MVESVQTTDLPAAAPWLRWQPARHGRLVRWLHGRSFVVTPEQLGIAEGLRAATAVAAMVLLTELLGRPVLAWGAFAAFWACLADPGGATRVRLRVMGGFVLAGTLLSGAMPWLAGFGPAVATPCLFAVVALCGMVRRFGAEAALAGVLASVVAVVAVDQPSAPAADALVALAFLSGGLVAMALCLLIWRIHPHGPARRAAAAVFRDLGHLAAELAERLQAGPRSGALPALDAAHRRAIRGTIERARAMVDRVAAGREDGAARRALSAAVDAGDRMFAGLIAIEHALELSECDAEAAPLVRVLQRLGDVLAVLERHVLRSNPDWPAIAAGADALAALGRGAPGLAGQVTRLWADALHPLSAGAAARPHRARAMPRPIGKAPDGAPLGTLLRHAARVATVVAIAYLITRWCALPYGYWATMAVVVVMQPQAATTLPRMLERMLGSVLGGAAAAALAMLLVAPWQLALVVFPLAAATIALRAVSYTLFVLFLTPLVVLVAELIAPGHGMGLAVTRATNNLLGSLLAFAGARILWPEPATPSFVDQLASAVEANLRYAAAVLRPDAAAAEVEAARREAGIRSTAAEEQRQGLTLALRRERARLDGAGRLLEILRRLAGATTAAWLAGTAAHAPDAASRAARYAALGARLGAQLRDGRPDAPAPATPEAAPDGIARAVTDLLAAVARCVKDPSGETGRRSGTP